MSSIEDFNRIEKCDKIDAKCVDAYLDYTYSSDRPTYLCVESSWGGDCIDLEPLVKAGETLTTLYLSPEENPNCLVYEPERGDNICINGDDLSRIISMQFLKDVSQETPPSDGIVYVYNSQTELFEPFDLATTLNNINTAISNLSATFTNITNRLNNLELALTPPEGAPSDAKVAWGTINLYSDHNAAINGSGAVTSLDKTHGLYTHSLNTNAAEDEIFG